MFGRPKSCSEAILLKRFTQSMTRKQSEARLQELYGMVLLTWHNTTPNMVIFIYDVSLCTVKQLERTITRYFRRWFNVLRILSSIDL